MIRPRGEVDLASTPALQRVLDEETTADRLVLDLTDVEFIDSSGLHLLLDLVDRCRETGRSVSIVRAAALERILSISGIADRLPLVDSADLRGPAQ